MPQKLESLFLDVTNNSGTIGDIAKIMTELRKAIKKIDTIEKIDGKKVTIYELALRGEHEEIGRAHV